MEKTISLYEALTGTQFVIKHLNGKNLEIKSEPGQVIKPNEIMTVQEHGLPFHKLSYKYGNMFILFKVKFPDKLAIDKVKSLKTILPKTGGSSDESAGDAEESVTMESFNESHRNTHHTGGT